MDTEIKPKNPQAFPQTWNREGTTDNWENGMNLIDFFANQAMGSILQNQEFFIKILQGSDPKELACDAVAKTAYTMADAMLRQRALYELIGKKELKK